MDELPAAVVLFRARVADGQDGACHFGWGFGAMLFRRGRGMLRSEWVELRIHGLAFRFTVRTRSGIDPGRAILAQMVSDIPVYRRFYPETIALM